MYTYILQLFEFWLWSQIFTYFLSLKKDWIALFLELGMDFAIISQTNR